MDLLLISVVQLALLVVAVGLAVVLLLRSGKGDADVVLRAVEKGFRQSGADASSQAASLRKELADGLARGEQGREARFANFEQAVASRVKELADEQKRLVTTTQQGLELTVTKSTQHAGELRNAVTTELKSMRSETDAQLTLVREGLALSLTKLQSSNEKRLDEMRVLVQDKLDEILEKRLGAFGKSVSDMRDMLKAELAEQRTSSEAKLQQVVEGEAKLREAISKDLKELRADNEGQIARMRDGVSKSITELQTSNEKKLEKMREVVEEKLQSTLDKRLGESFKRVGEQLEAVHKGLGEMQSLATGVGDLKKVLTNVKTRGTWGEVQLGGILEHLLTSDQYQQNVCTVPGSGDSVEYAIRLPGQVSGQPVWLPIDSKFPVEDYQRLVDASQAGDQAGVDASAKALQRRICDEAKKIRDKYVAPPHTTDFAIMFLPTEGLYAEVLRAPGLADNIQRDFRVVIAGPTTLTALVNSLRIGFKTLAIQERSSEVWQVLGGVKTEFGKFGDVLAKIKKQLGTVQNTIESSERRTRAMERKLRSVEELPADLAQDVLELERLSPPADDEEELPT